MSISITVIVPIFNEEKNIGKCLDSILNNTFQDYEVLCINDGSTDGTAEVLKEYEKRDFRIKVIEQENKGVSAARNNGMDHAKGKYICFVDGDDTISCEFFEVLINLHRNTQCDVTACDFYTNSGTGEIEKAVLVGIKEYCQNSQFLKYITKKLFRREFVNSVRFNENIPLGEDTIFNIQLIINVIKHEAAFKCFYINKQMYQYIDNPFSAMHTSSAEKWRPACEWYTAKAAEEDNKMIQALLITEGTKKMMQARYNAWIGNDFQGMRTMNSYLKTMRRLLIKNSNITIKKKIEYYLLNRFSAIYRLYRIHDDPTLKIYEKNVRRLQSNRL